MNSAELEESLGTYRAQIAALEEAAAGSSDASEKAELGTLLDDLRELVELTEGQLDDLRAAAQLSAVPSSSAQADEDDDEDDDEEDEEMESVGEVIQKLREQLLGMRCRAPYDQGIGPGLRVHNAIVLEAVEGGEAADVAALPLRVLFSNPTSSRQRPCTHFLRSACTYGDKCKFSHGEVVKFGDLLEYEEPDYEALEKGSRCLVKSGDLWVGGEISSICRDEKKCAVRLLQTGKEEAVGFADVLPLPPAEEEAESPSEPAPQFPSAVIQWTPTQHKADSALGGWEKHTKGIGSKLMAQMGYVVGSGLGRDGVGIVNPITATIHPKGKSLDHIMDARAAQGGDDSRKAIRARRRLERKERLKAQKLAEGGLRNAVELGVFDFLNRKLAKSKADKAPKPKRKVDLKSQSVRSLNVQLLENDSKERKLRAEIAKHKESIRRNTGRNPVVVAHAQKKVAEYEAGLASLDRKSTIINREQDQRRDKKKLAIF